MSLGHIDGGCAVLASDVSRMLLRLSKINFGARRERWGLAEQY